MAQEPKPMCGAQYLYRETGYFLKRRRMYGPSLRQFGQSTAIDSKNIRNRQGRAWTRMAILDFKGALKDIEVALQTDPDNLRTLALRALVLYTKTDFEDAYVKFVRGAKKRIKPPHFTKGMKFCNEVIENCLGARTGHPLRDHYDIIRTIAMKRAYDLHKGQQYKAKGRKRKKKVKGVNMPDINPKVAKVLPKQAVEERESEDCIGSILESLHEKNDDDFLFRPIQKSKYQPLQRRTTNIDNLLSEKYLQAMYKDKIFLNELKYDPRIKSPNYDGVISLRSITKRGHKDLSTRQEILRARRPFYAIKYKEGQLTPAVLKRQLDDIHKTGMIVERNVNNLLSQLELSKSNRRTEECIQLADKLKTYIDKTPLKILPNKEEYLQQLYELIGLAHMDKFRLNPEHDMDLHLRRIHFLFGIPPSREPSQESVIKSCEESFKDVRQAIKLTVKRLEAATTPLETVWLFFELSRYNLSIKKWEWGRIYARKCINLARTICEPVWVINGMMMLIRVHFQQGKKNEAKKELQRCKLYAKEVENPNLKDYIEKCIQAVDLQETDFQDNAKIIKEREDKIAATVKNIELKSELRHLYAMMGAIPENRRMPIMPGIIYRSLDDPEEEWTLNDIKRALRNRKSIKPSPEHLEFNQKIEALGQDILQELS